MHRFILKTFLRLIGDMHHFYSGITVYSASRHIRDQHVSLNTSHLACNILGQMKQVTEMLDF